MIYSSFPFFITGEGFLVGGDIASHDHWQRLTLSCSYQGGDTASHDAADEVTNASAGA